MDCANLPCASGHIQFINTKFTRAITKISKSIDEDRNGERRRPSSPSSTSFDFYSDSSRNVQFSQGRPQRRSCRMQCGLLCGIMVKEISGRFCDCLALVVSFPTNNSQSGHDIRRTITNLNRHISSSSRGDAGYVRPAT